MIEIEAKYAIPSYLIADPVNNVVMKFAQETGWIQSHRVVDQLDSMRDTDDFDLFAHGFVLRMRTHDDDRIIVQSLKSVEQGHPGIMEREEIEEVVYEEKDRICDCDRSTIETLCRDLAPRRSHYLIQPDVFYGEKALITVRRTLAELCIGGMKAELCIDRGVVLVNDTMVAQISEVELECKSPPQPWTKDILAGAMSQLRSYVYFRSRCPMAASRSKGVTAIECAMKGAANVDQLAI